MNALTIFSKIMGFLVIIITLALAPSINTANAVIVAHDNVSEMLGMAAVSAFGAPLIILGLLVAGGVFAIAGAKGQLSAKPMNLFAVIGSVIVLIVVITMFDNVMTYTAQLMAASSGFAVTLYSVIPIVIYVGIIAMAGWASVSGYRKMRGKSRSKKITQFA